MGEGHDKAFALARKPVAIAVARVPSDQLQPLHARMPILADNDVIMHGNPERRGDVDDRLGHLDIRT